MDMLKFAAMNRDRCQAPGGFNHSISDWSLSDWFTATMGELGEAANIAKKLNRARDGITGNTESESIVDLRAALADEIADTFIYLDLLAQSQGFVLAEIVQTKWDKTSRKIGYRTPMLPLFDDGDPVMPELRQTGFDAGHGVLLSGYCEHGTHSSNICLACRDPRQQPLPSELDPSDGA